MLRKLSNMENQIKDLKAVHSFKFDQLEGITRHAGVTSKGSSRSSLGASRSVSAKSESSTRKSGSQKRSLVCADTGSKKERQQQLPETAEDSLNE